MRISLIVHGFPPNERTGVENYTRSLAAALARAGHAVEVFAPGPPNGLPHLALRREETDGFGVTWLASGPEPTGPEEMLNPKGVASRFGDFLDRERPDLVHFQHVVKLGTGLIAEAEKRGIPTVYTAHDYYAFCHRYTLLRPDLERCEKVGDPKACARCDQALAVLNGVEKLGDYQMGALAEQLSKSNRAKLTAALEGRSKEAGFTKEDGRNALELRETLDKRRAEDFEKLDLVLAPTKFLRDRLIEGGVEGKRIQHLPYGIETEELERVARDSAVQRGSSSEKAPLRIGYFGGFSKHKGVHVLLEAFRQLKEPAELSLHGLGTDKPYVELLKKLSRKVKAKWRGAYESHELPRALASVDVVVVPSLWVENYPIVIREAFAAGRPVITSNLGALPESVRDGVDGLLFEPGDAKQLALLLDRCASENGLLANMAAKIKRVHSIDDQAKELQRIYQSVGSTKVSRAKRDLPVSLRESVARYEELLARPSRELFLQTMSGIGELGSKLLKKSTPDTIELLTKALARRSDTQNQLRDRRRESDWVRQTLVEEERELSALTQKIDWMSDVVDGREKAVRDLKRERSWLSESIAAKKLEVEALASERDDMARARVDLDQQREWLERDLAAKVLEVEGLHQKEAWLESEVANRLSEIEELETKSEWQVGTIAGLKAQVVELEKKCGWFEETIASKTAELEAAEGRVEGVEQALAAKAAELAERELAMRETEKRAGWLEGVLDDRTAAIGELEKKSTWLEGLLKESRERAKHFEHASGRQESARDELVEKLALVERSALESEQRVAEQAETLQRFGSIEFELRAWLVSSRETLIAFDEKGPSRDAGQDPGAISDAVRGNWESLLHDVERVLDFDEVEVAPDDLGRRVELLLDRLDTEERELHWRRLEMDHVQDRADQWIGKRFSMLVGELRNRIRSWSAEPGKGESR